jgi:hypothetical protein
MAFAGGGILVLVGIVLYAAVETRLELRNDRQQLTDAEKSLSYQPDDS